MKKLNRDKKEMIIFKPKNDDQNEKNEKIKKNMISSPWLAEMNIMLCRTGHQLPTCPGSKYIYVLSAYLPSLASSQFTSPAPQTPKTVVGPSES